MSQTPEDFATKYTRTNWLSRLLLDGFFDAVGQLLSGMEGRDSAQRNAAGGPVSSAIEIGCGGGFSTQRLRSMLPSGASFRASDVEDRLVQAASAANPGVSVARESIYQLPHADNAFDLVFVLEVLEHLDDPASALAEVCRISRRWVVVSTPREPIWRMMNLVRGRYVRRLGNTPGHRHNWSSGQFRQFVQTFADVRAVRTPLPWTVILSEVRKPGTGA